MMLPRTSGHEHDLLNTLSLPQLETKPYKLVDTPFDVVSLLNYTPGRFNSSFLCHGFNICQHVALWKGQVVLRSLI